MKSEKESNCTNKSCTLCMAGVALGVFMGFIFSQAQILLNEEPDFSISIYPPLPTFYLGGEDYATITIHNDHKFLWWHSYGHSISLDAFERGKQSLPDGIELEFQPPYLSLFGKDVVSSNMTIKVTSDYRSYNVPKIITILALGGDGKERSCSTPLKVTGPEIKNVEIQNSTNSTARRM